MRKSSRHVQQPEARPPPELREVLGDCLLGALAAASSARAACGSAHHAPPYQPVLCNCRLAQVICKPPPLVIASMNELLIVLVDQATEAVVQRQHDHTVLTAARPVGKDWDVCRQSGGEVVGDHQEVQVPADEPSAQERIHGRHDVAHDRRSKGPGNAPRRVALPQVPILDRQAAEVLSKLLLRNIELLACDFGGRPLHEVIVDLLHHPGRGRRHLQLVGVAVAARRQQPSGAPALLVPPAQLTETGVCLRRIATGGE
mmetsp:Transcript_92469/g.298882  ORF Transcript_92469/g.298882 Transcript_92469/m.298882 type:complete len:258 (+) Transcript_92469:603-1376(+)